MQNQIPEIRVTASIVTYNNGDKAIEAVHSILSHTTGVSLQLYISDNASSDDTVDRIRAEFPQVIVQENGKNGGFGWGHNQIIKQVDSDYHAIINPDIYCRRIP